MAKKTINKELTGAPVSYTHLIPMTNPNNNVAEINKGLRIYEIYPYKHMMTVEYDDDGISEAYKAVSYTHLDVYKRQSNPSA